VTPQNWQMAMTKKDRQFFFQKKIGVTPLVAARGDTHPSDATVLMPRMSMVSLVLVLIATITTTSEC